MQLTLKEWMSNSADGLNIWIYEGTTISCVVRSSDGNYTCYREQCRYQRRENHCEHARFAMHQYVDVIAVTAERKAELERQKVLEEIARQKTRLKLLEQQLGVKEEEPQSVLLDMELKRRIVI